MSLNMQALSNGVIIRNSYIVKMTNLHIHISPLIHIYCSDDIDCKKCLFINQDYD